MREIAIEGSLKSDPVNKEFEINFDLPNGLKIKGLGKSFFTSKNSVLPNENGIYILEGEDKIYIGQSKNLQSRLKSHSANDKINFIRCFMIYHINDIRGHLDFMEAYTINEMIQQGYYLDNGQMPDPELDKLSSAKKSAAKDWINEFLLFLPVLGFRKNNNKGLSEITNMENNSKEIRCSLFLKNKNSYKCNGNGLFLSESQKIKIRKGSVGIWSTKKYPLIFKQQNELEKAGIIKTDPHNKNLFIFIVDNIFNSVSMAGRILVGTNVNGWVTWQLENGNLLDTLRSKRLH